jgi:chromosome segregation ATPase
MKQYNQGNRIKSGLKTAGNTIVNNNNNNSSKKSNLLLINDIQKTPGNGLWCVNLEKNKSENSLPQQSEYQPLQNILNPNLDVDQEFEKKIISQLKIQIQDLNQKLNNAMTKSAEAEYRANRSENTKQNYVDLYEQKVTELKDYQEKVESFENTIINLNDALTNAKKEINRLQSENNLEVERSKKYYEMYQNLMLDKDRKESTMSAEITNLMMKIQMVNSEKENFIRLIKSQQMQYSNNENLSQMQKMAEEKENSLKITESQMGRLINENADLKKKLGDAENLKSKLNEIIKKKKNKITNLKQEVNSYRNAIGGYNSEVKWSQDLVAQRDTQIKVLKDKIKKYEDEIDKLNKLNEKLKSKKNSTTNYTNYDNQEELQQVKSKPFLFGPETTD